SASGAAYSTDWGAPGQNVDASTATTVTIILTGDNSLIQLGDASVSEPASANLATFAVTAASGNTADSVIIDDSSSTAATTYTANTGSGIITTTPPGINLNLTPGAFAGGITLEGSSGADTYNVLSTYSGDEPVTIDGGSGSNVVNVGSNPGTPASSTLGGIVSLLTVNDATGTTTLNLLDAGDTASASGNVTGTTVTGLGFGSGGSVAYTGGTTTEVTSLV